MTPNPPNSQRPVKSELQTHNTSVIEEMLDELRADIDELISDQSKVGKYEVVRTLGCHGQATVVLARDPDLLRLLVLKIYHTGLSGQHRSRILNEGRALAGVSTPYVATCYGVEEIGEQLILVLEFIDGQSLEEYRAKLTLSLPEKLQIVRQITQGVASVHDAGLLHRDLKSSNVMVTSSDDIKLIDFGLVASSDVPDHDSSGTPAYMPPERATGSQRPFDERGDIFGIGAILYELLCGEPPFAAESKESSRRLAKQGRVTPPKQLDQDLDDRVENLCMKCLATKPEDRFQSAQELLKAIDSCLQINSSSSIDATESADAVQKSNGMAIVALVSAIILLAWGIWYVATTNEQPKESVQPSPQPSMSQPLAARSPNEQASAGSATSDQPIESSPGNSAANQPTKEANTLEVVRDFYPDIDRFDEIRKACQNAIAERKVELARQLAQEGLDLASKEDLKPVYLPEFQAMNREIETWAEAETKTRDKVSNALEVFVVAVSEVNNASPERKQELAEQLKTTIVDLKAILGKFSIFSLKSRVLKLNLEYRLTEEDNTLEAAEQMLIDCRSAFGDLAEVTYKSRKRLATLEQNKGQNVAAAIQIHRATVSFLEDAPPCGRRLAMLGRLKLFQLTSTQGQDLFQESLEHLQKANEIFETLPVNRKSKTAALDAVHLLYERLVLERRTEKYKRRSKQVKRHSIYWTRSHKTHWERCENT